MSNLHEVKEHIGSVQSTKKITRAMYLISASKSQKAKSQLAATLPYFQKIIGTMREILAGEDEFETPFIRDEEDQQWKRAHWRPNAFLLIGADKGMAGGYNHNVMALLEQHAKKDEDTIWVVGKASRSKLEKLGYKVDHQFDFAVMNPDIRRARDISEKVVSAYESGKYHGIYIIFTEMLSAVRQDPSVMPLLPLDLRPLKKEKTQEIKAEEIEYIPSPRVVFDALVPFYLKGIIYGALVEAFASEQQARMMAMDNATKSADETIGRLNLEYNQARQGQITQELTEIISGIPENNLAEDEDE